MKWKYWWWKLATIIIFIYVISAGLLIPLKPGIEEISPVRSRVGDTLGLQIKAYNTSFTKGSLEVFIKSRDSFWISTKDLKVADDRTLTANFIIPYFLPDPSSLSQYSIIVSSSYDGSFVIPGKLILSQDSVNLSEAQKLWSSGNPQFASFAKMKFPYRNILYETIRNTFFHVSLWFAMFALLGASVYHSYKYLSTNLIEHDTRAFAQVRTAILFGLMGLATGSLWARFTWGSWWTNDVKLNMAALSMLIYAAYLILRAGISEIDRKARISAAFNVFALIAIVPLIFILPRLTDSLHPGNGGNPAFGSEDMDNSLRKVFYPAVTGFIMLGFWLSGLLYRVEKLHLRIDNEETQRDSGKLNNSSTKYE